MVSLREIVLASVTLQIVFAHLRAGARRNLCRQVFQSQYGDAYLAMSLFSISLIIAGVSMVWFEMLLLLVSLHNGLAAGLLICSVQLLHRLTPQSAAPL
jgi:hypothetical protein